MGAHTYLVPAISCDHCERAIETEVGSVTGVERVTADVSRRSVTVVGDAHDAEVRAAITRAGYEVERVLD